MLIIKNGQIDGDNRILDAISSARVFVNGVEIFGPSDFKQNDYLMTALIDLAENNTISVELASQPNSFITIDVTQDSPLPTVSLSSDHDTIQVGESIILSWSCANADSAAINQGFGNVPLEGTATISLLQTTTFTITATGPEGTDTANVTITVLHPVPMVEITAKPESISSGAATTLSWSASYADGCEINPDVGQVPTNGSINVSPGQTTTYTISAVGPGGSAMADATVTVVYPPSMVVVKPNGVDDEADTVFTIKWTDFDPDDNATISLYYDADNSGSDGTLIVSGLPEDPDGEADDGYVWNTTHIAEGKYYVYGVIDDGVNDPVVAYSTGDINIAHTILHEIKLTAGDSAAEDNFGSAVSISGDYAIVGAPHDDDAGASSGSAYVFKRKGSTWVEQAKLKADDAAPEDNFGHSVSISGEYAVVGAYGDDDGGEDSGSVYVFRREGEIWAGYAKIVSGDASAYDYFGWSVAVDDDYAVVGAYGDDDGGSESGAAYVFKLAGTTWAEEAKLTAGDGEAYDYFGWSVSINGNSAIVGAYGDDDGGIESGAAYIFKRNSPWYIDRKLTAADREAYDNFGWSVSLNGNLAIVGAYNARGTHAGAAYIFMIDAPLGSSFIEKLTSSDGTAGDRFGSSVALSGATVMVGGGGQDAGGISSCAAYVYPVCTVDVGAEPGIITAGGSSTLSWTSKNAGSISIDQGIGAVSAKGSLAVSPGQTTTYTITASGLAGTSRDSVTVNVIDPSVPPTVIISATDYFGAYSTLTWSSTNADACFIAPDIGTVALSGHIHVSPSETTTYTIIATGPAGTVTAETEIIVMSPSSYEVKIIPEDPVTDGGFGTSVCISGEYAIVGSQNRYGYPESYSGRALIYKHDGLTWNKQTELIRNPVSPPGSGESGGSDRFGWSVAMSGDYAVVGFYGDSRVNIYKRDCTTWNVQRIIYSSDTTRRDRFAYSLSIDGDYVIVGAPYDDEGGEYSGASYIFKRDGVMWTKQAKLKASDAEPEDFFGHSVSIGGDYCIVGIKGSHYYGSSSGAAYVYKREGSNWIEQAKLIPQDVALDDQFGYSVAISGDTAIIGAMGDDDVGNNSGAVYVFKRTGETWSNQAKLSPSDLSENDRFGWSVSLDVDHAIVGSKSAAWIFRRSGETWAEFAKLLPSDKPFYYGYYRPVFLDGDYAIIGADSDSVEGESIHTGAAYIYHYKSSYLSLSADPEIILINESSTLSWTSSNAGSISIDQGIGTVSSIGAHIVSPGRTTTYTITAVGPAGATTKSVTVNVIDPSVPPTVTLTSYPEVVYAGVNATLSWSSTNATSCVITPDIGGVDLSGTIKVSPEATTTYTISATGPAGTATAEVTVTTSCILPPNIIYPSDCEVINRHDTLIRGQIVNMSGAETGVTVRGVVAMIYGNEFVANHVPLDEGVNTITAIATDTEENTIETSVTVNAAAAEKYIQLTADEYEGVSPFETKMTIDASFDISNVSLTYVGPGIVETLDTPSKTEYVMRITGAGIYYFTSEVKDSTGITYKDTIGVVVRDEATEDETIKARWSGMKAWLIQGNIQGALDFYSPLTINENEQILTALGADLPSLVGNMEDIEKIYIRGCVAKYRIKKDEMINGETQRVTYYIYFVRDVYGVWHIDGF